MTLDRREHFLLGSHYADDEPRGECAWTLLGQNMWPVARWSTTRLARMPYPRWWRGAHA